MAKRRHEAEQASSSKTALIGMSAAGLAVAALVVWALTRTVQPVPSVMAEAPTAAEQPAATNAPVSLDTALNPVQITTAQSSTAAPVPPPQSDENASVKRISVPELRSRIDGKQVTVIDVRDKTSFVTNHIPGALNIPVAQVESQVTYLPKDKPIVTYCT